MAQYIKLRVTAAKVGVSMALLGLIAGLAERASAAAPRVKAKPAAAKISVPTLDRSFQKLDSTLVKIEHKLAKSYFTSQKINSTFLKIKSANTSFLKIRSANASFLKIDDASTEFLKIKGVAANSNELGGAQADAYVNNAVGSVSVAAGGSAALLHTPDGMLSVSVGDSIGAGVSVTITNNTSSLLPAVQDLGGADSQVSLNANGNHTIPLLLGKGNAAMLHLQLFPVPGLFGSVKGEAVTLILSAELNSTTGMFDFVGQLVAGTL